MFNALRAAHGAGWRAGMNGENDYEGANPFKGRLQIIHRHAWFEGWLAGSTRKTALWIDQHAPVALRGSMYRE